MKRIHVKDLFVAQVWNSCFDISSVPTCITTDQLYRILEHHADVLPDAAEMMAADLEEEAARVGFHNLKKEKPCA